MLRFIAKFNQAALILVLPLNVALAYDYQMPLEEADAIMVCVAYSCMGLAALVINLATNLSQRNCERPVLLVANFTAIAGLVAQLCFGEPHQMKLALLGFLVSYLAVQMLDGAVLSLTSSFLPPVHVQAK